MTRRALVLAGGGLKVAFQAGVLQVWLDEVVWEDGAPPFAHADGTSAGVLNLALYCQGASGREIADAWRRTRPLDCVGLNWGEAWKLAGAASLLTLERFRRLVLEGAWRLRIDEVRRSRVEATFNAFDVSSQAVTTWDARELTMERLLACMALPFWYPPLHEGSRTYVDAVFATDANLEEAIRRGADELWIVWTVSTSGEWRPGAYAGYFQIVEQAANWGLRTMLRRIEASNAAGKRGEFGRPITVRMLEAEVPLNYVVTLSQRQLREAVERGVQAARGWCDAHGIERRPAPPSVPTPPSRLVALSFRERMHGTLAVGAAGPAAAPAPAGARGWPLELRLEVRVDDLDRFLVDPAHEAAIRGTVVCGALGGERPCRGTFNLMADAGRDPARKRMLYRLELEDAAGEALILVGVKRLEDDPGADEWADTTTLAATLTRADGSALAAGVLRLTAADLARQLASFRVSPRRHTLAAIARFDVFFAGRLLDVYRRRYLPWSPA